MFVENTNFRHSSILLSNFQAIILNIKKMECWVLHMFYNFSFSFAKCGGPLGLGLNWKFWIRRFNLLMLG